MRPKTFIYVIHSPADPYSIYVGKADDPAHRLRDHLRRGPKERSTFGMWLKEREDRCEPVEIVRLEEVEYSEWKCAERFWELYFSSIGSKLLNTAPCGNGPGSMSAAMKARHSVIMKRVYSNPKLVERRNRATAAGTRRPEVRARQSELTRSMMSDPRRKAMIAGMSLGDVYLLRDSILGLRANGLRPAEICRRLGSAKMVYEVCSGKHWSCKL